MGPVGPTASWGPWSPWNQAGGRAPGGRTAGGRRQTADGGRWADGKTPEHESKQ